MFGQNIAFWFVLGKKMCFYHGLLGVGDTSLTPPLTLGSADPLTPLLRRHWVTVNDQLPALQSKRL